MRSFFGNIAMHRMKKCLVFAVFGISALVSNHAVSETRQHDANTEGYNPAQGFHFYDPLKLPAEEIAEKVVEKLLEKAASTPKAEEKPGSSAWIKKHLPDVRRQAADEPTTENIRALLLMEKMLRDKGMRLARRASMIAQTDPQLDSSYKPTSNIAMARERRSKLGVGQDKLVEKLVEDGVAAWIFVNKDCSSCESWISSMAAITKKFSIKILWIIEEGLVFPETPEFTDEFWEYRVASNEVEELGVKSDISLFAYNEKKEQYVLVSQGFVPSSSFPAKLLLSADFSGWVTPQEIEETVFGVNKNDLSDPDSEGFNGDYSNPQEYSNYIYDRLVKGL